MRKRAAALLLSVLLVFQLTLPAARAAEEVYFLAAGIDILPLSDGTMPCWSGGYLYIPASTFTGAGRRTLEVEFNYVESSEIVILSNSFAGGDQFLFFSMKENHAVDKTGTISYPGAMWRNGKVYVPAALVAKTFGLQYSVTEVDHGYLVWLRKPDFGLSDKNFANAASYSMATRYNEYLKSQKPAETPGEDRPEAPDLSTGKRVYLCLEAGDDTPLLLDALDRYDARAAFYATPEFLESQGDLLRRMTATGQAVGITVDAADTAQSIQKQLEAGNRALERATCTKTRLVRVENGEEQTLQEVRNLGYVPLEPDLDRSSYELRTAGNGNALFQRVSARRGDVTVWLAGTAQAGGLRSFLASADRAEARCLALTETA